MATPFPIAAFQAELGSILSSSQIAMVPKLEPDFSISFGGPAVGEPRGPVEVARSEWEPVLFSTHLDDFLENADPAKADSLRLSSVMQSRQTLRDWTRLPFGKLLREEAEGQGDSAVLEGSPYRRAFQRMENLSVDQIAVTVPGITVTDVPPDAVRDAALELLCSIGPSWGSLGGNWLQLHNFTQRIPTPLRERISKAFTQQEKGRWPSAIFAAKRLFLSGLLFKNLGGEDLGALSDILLFYSAKLLHDKHSTDAAAMVIDLISNRMPDLSLQSHRGWLSSFSAYHHVLWDLDPRESVDPGFPLTDMAPLALRISQGMVSGLVHEDWLTVFYCGQLLRLFGPRGISAEPGWRHDLRSAFSLLRYLEMNPDITSHPRNSLCLATMLERIVNGMSINGQYGHLDR